MIWASGTYMLPLTISIDDADSCSGSGRQDENVAELRRKPSIAKQVEAWDTDKLRRELREYGAWDDQELADDDANRTRMLWLACCDLREQFPATED